MVFGIFKGCRSEESVAIQSHHAPFKGGAHTATTRTAACDDSLSSEKSKANLLEMYAAKGQWDAVIQLVAKSHVEDWAMSSSSLSSSASASSPTASNNHSNTNDESAVTTASTTPPASTPLHLALVYRAPVHVVDALVRLSKEHLDWPAPEEVQDEWGRTPLHVAVEAGCDEDTVERLLAGDNLVMPAVLRDEQDRTALHVACASPVIKQKKASVFGANQLAMDTWNKRRVISVLLQHYPEAATLADKTDKTPLDYAVENKFSKRSVHELQQACEIYTPSIMAGPMEQPESEAVSSLAYSDVPLIIPTSVDGSRHNSAAHLDSLLQQAAPDPELDSPDNPTNPHDDDVSTLGDAEVEMYQEFEIEGDEHP